jgi:hypothetical protein
MIKVPGSPDQIGIAYEMGVYESLQYMGDE